MRDLTTIVCATLVVLFVIFTIFVKQTIRYDYQLRFSQSKSVGYTVHF